MLLCIGVRSLPLLLLFFLLFDVHGSAPISSPPASTDLICHTSHASECYPAVFQPTEYFQQIHEDQSLPAGLHVRINLATGLKEARLNVPESLGTTHADPVIVGDLLPRPSIEEEHDSVMKLPEPQDQSNLDTDYQRLGQYYPTALSTEESSLFYSSINSLRSTAALSIADLPALSILVELAHAIQWGVALAQDTAVCRILLDAIDPGSVASNEIRLAATLLLGTAIHNNPDALSTLLSRPHSSEAGLTPTLTVLAALRAPGQGDIMLKTRTVFLISQLCQDNEQLRILVHSGGLDTMFDLFDPEKMTPDDEKGKFRSKAANFIHDRILSTFDNTDDLGPHSGPETSARGGNPSLKSLGPWCYALAKALRMYQGAGMRATDTVYQSIREANQALEKAHARLRMCTNEYEL